MSGLEAALSETAADVERVLDRLLRTPAEPHTRLMEAMRYSTLGGGKRLRPFLVMQSASLFAVAQSCALRVAAAVECVHCYSLVHDDLPAMDNDDLRRGRPTTHKAFDDATAILAGDGLLTLAFEILGDPETHADPAVRCGLIQALSKAAGARGMVGGQMLDIIAETQVFDMGEITRLQRLKTGELFAFSCVAGAILGKAEEHKRHALQAYAHDMGLAFQIADDLLDVEGSREEVGKSVGKDSAAGKGTFVSILGIERAHAQAKILVEQAIGHLEPFGERAEHLRGVARYVVSRRS